jgi:hypothetical protein
MRNYKRKRIGWGNLYVAIDKSLGLARIGFSTNLYTTQANLAKNWEVLSSYEFEDAGIIDKKISNLLRSERAIDYQSSKSYRLDSYRVQKLIRLLGGKFEYPSSKDHDVCECLECGVLFEVQYNSPMSIRRFIEIHDEDMRCDNCSKPVKDLYAQLKMKKVKIDDSVVKRKKEIRVWSHYKDRDIKETEATKIARMEKDVRVCVICNMAIPTSRNDDCCSYDCEIAMKQCLK